MFFYGIFGAKMEECDMYAADPSQVATCRSIRSEESQAVRAGVAVGFLVGATAVWFYKRKG